MLIFEADYGNGYTECDWLDFSMYDGPSREAFFHMIEDEGEAFAARVRLRATGHIIDEWDFTGGDLEY